MWIYVVAPIQNSITVVTCVCPSKHLTKLSSPFIIVWLHEEPHTYTGTNVKERGTNIGHRFISQMADAKH